VRKGTWWGVGGGLHVCCTKDNQQPTLGQGASDGCGAFEWLG
jgi:hypothetical protein